MSAAGPQHGISKHTYEIKVTISVINNTVNLYCFVRQGFGIQPRLALNSITSWTSLPGLQLEVCATMAG